MVGAVGLKLVLPPLDVGIHADAIVEVAAMETIHVREIIEHVRRETGREEQFVDERLALVGARIFGKSEELFAGGDASENIEIDATNEEVVGERFVEGVKTVLLKVAGTWTSWSRSW